MRIGLAITWMMAAWASAAVDFQKDIQPLLKNKCSRCHSGHEAKGGFSINTRTTLLDGAQPGDSAASLLYQLIISKDPDERMPSKGDPLAVEEIALMMHTWAFLAPFCQVLGASGRACSCIRIRTLTA